jgi:hypothetical protein
MLIKVHFVRYNNIVHFIYQFMTFIFGTAFNRKFVVVNPRDGRTRKYNMMTLLLQKMV